MQEKMAGYWREYVEDVEVSPFPKLTDNNPTSRRQTLSIETELSMGQHGTGQLSFRRNIIKAVWALVLSKYTNSTDIGFFAELGDLGRARTSLIKASVGPTFNLTDLLGLFRQDEMKSSSHCMDTLVGLLRYIVSPEKAAAWNTMIVFEDLSFMTDSEDSDSSDSRTDPSPGAENVSHALQRRVYQ
jgi:hypothetical protein